MKHRFLGRTYTVSFVKMKDMGDCCYPDRIMRIRKSLKGLDLLDTVCHESLHASLDDLDEDTVNKLAEDLSKLLWELGYRKIDLGMIKQKRKRK